MSRVAIECDECSFEQRLNKLSFMLTAAIRVFLLPNSRLVHVNLFATRQFGNKRVVFMNKNVSFFHSQNVFAKERFFIDTSCFEFFENTKRAVLRPSVVAWNSGVATVLPLVHPAKGALIPAFLKSSSLHACNQISSVQRLRSLPIRNAELGRLSLPSIGDRTSQIDDSLGTGAPIEIRRRGRVASTCVLYRRRRSQVLGWVHVYAKLCFNFSQRIQREFVTSMIDYTLGVGCSSLKILK